MSDTPPASQARVAELERKWKAQRADNRAMGYPDSMSAALETSLSLISRIHELEEALEDKRPTALATVTDFPVAPEPGDQTE